MDKAQVIYTEASACRDCYKCLRECPVKAIRIVDDHAMVVGELCVHCGHCVEVCPQKAKKVRDDLARAKLLVELRPKAVLSLAPSFAAEFPGIEIGSIVAAAKSLGFAAVSETSLGADLVSAGLCAFMAKEAPELLISSACPVVVRYIDKYLPALSERISRSASPMVAHGRYLKRVFGPETAVVFAGPCIAKKWEADQSEGSVDLALTFAELRTWLGERKIDLSATTPGPGNEFFPTRSSHGALYPIEGGMIASLKRAGLKDVHCMTFGGMAQIQGALRDIEEGIGSAGGSPEGCLFLELLACEGGCVNGPLAGGGSGTVARRLRVLSYGADRPESPGSGEPPAALVTGPAGLRGSAVAEEDPAPEALRTALASIGKSSRKDELNCSGCGYDSCRAFATAMLKGRAERTMCVSYTRNLAQKKADALLKAMPSAAVVVDDALKVVECNDPFAELLGPEGLAIREVRPGLEGADLRKLLPFWEDFEEVLSPDRRDSISADYRVGEKIVHGTIFGIEKGHIAGALFQDITAPWMQKDRVIKQARKVMHQNLKTVQRIAYLLGENAAEAEAALTSIVESFGAKDDDSPRNGRQG